MSPEEESLLVEKVATLTRDLDTLRAIVLGVGELITGSITRLENNAIPVLNSDTQFMLVTTADAEVTHAPSL